MSARYAFNLLGAPTFTQDGVERHLPSRRVLALLACLAIDGRSSRARLASILWGQTEEARRNLRRELARLREAGLDRAFEADLESIRLGDAVTSDVAVFQVACERGDAGAALALWRGPPMEGFALGGEAPEFDDWLAERREALVRRWREVAASAAAHREAIGDGRGALEWHLRLLAEDALQERHYASVMRLHHLLGERSAALAVYERCRRLLAAELGLEPLASTVALAETIRAAERLAPLVARPIENALRTLDVPLVGRAAEAAALRERGAAVLLLQGEPGVGKTRLAQECLLARSTLSVRCEAVAQGTPLHSIGDALRAALEQPGRRERLATLSDADRREAARLLPTLDPQAQFTSARESGVVDRSRFFNALGEVLDRLVGAGGTIWIDDLHWADSSTLALVSHLAHRHAADPSAHAHIVAAARTEELLHNPAVQDTVRALERGHLLARIPLGVLDAAETLALVRALSSSRDGSLFGARLQKATRGNPYYLLETIRFLFDAGELQIDAQGAWATRYDDATADYAELPVPPTLAATVIERVERLGAAARRVLETAALTSAGFTLAQVQPATALSEWEALDGLERAVQAELLATFAGGYRFVHDLAREAIAAQLGSERRRMIHDRLAAGLIAQQARADLIAMHLEGAERSSEAMAWRVSAGRDAERLLAWTDALSQYGQALALGASIEEQISVRRSRASVLRTLHDLAAMQGELDALDALAAQTLDAPLALEVIASRTELAVKQHRLPEAIAQFRLARAHPVWPTAEQSVRHRVIQNGAFALVESGEYSEGLALYERELASADTQPAAFLGVLHHGMGNYHMSFGENETAKEHVLRSIAYCAAAGEDELRLRSMNSLAYCQFCTGSAAAAVDTLQRVLDEAEQLKHVSLLRFTLLNFILYAVETGDVDRAGRQLARAMQLLRGIDDPATQSRLQVRVSEVAALRGDLALALGAARSAIVFFEANRGGLPDFWPWFVLSRLLWRIGDREAAARVYEELPRSPAWRAAGAAAVRFFAAAWRLPHDTASAALLVEPVEPNSAVLLTQEIIDQFRALAMHALGRDADALALLEAGDRGTRKPSFVTRGEDRIALLLDVHVALGLDATQVLAEAQSLLPAAAPLLALRLHRSIAAAWQAAGASDRAAQHEGEARLLAARLEQSLAEEPDLRARFHAEHLAGAATRRARSPS
jgi:DNA-binding SARP family transcriptional activator